MAEPQNQSVTGKQAGGVTILAMVFAILAATFANEGGYVNHPSDPGGATNHGVTVAVAREKGFSGNMRDLKRECDFPIVLPSGIRDALSEAELQALETDEDGDTPCAAQILFEDYILAPGFLPLVVIDDAVAEEVIDTAVNMGPYRPSRYFQRAVNQVCNTRLVPDGRVGPLSVKAWRDCRDNLGPRACVRMLDALDRQQEAEYDRLVRVNPKLRAFRRGWQNLRIGNVDRARCWA
ncbi:glycosyl hydrolase 108 family protein [Citromicrobium bathyomarinum]